MATFYLTSIKAAPHRSGNVWNTLPDLNKPIKSLLFTGSFLLRGGWWGKGLEAGQTGGERGEGRKMPLEVNSDN